MAWQSSDCHRLVRPSAWLLTACFQNSSPTKKSPWSGLLFLIAPSKETNAIIHPLTKNYLVS